MLGITVALACALALVPGQAEAGYKYVRQWAVPTEADAIAVGSGGVYVSNGQSASTPSKVTRYTPEGRLTATLGSFERPGAGGLSVGPDGRVWLVDLPGTVRVFDPGGKQLEHETFLDSCGTGSEVWIDDLEVDATGALYVTLYDNCDLGGGGSRRAVVHLAFPGWRVAKAWGGLEGATNDGGFGRSALRVASNGRGAVYVTDSGNERVQQFTSTGTFVRKWGQLGHLPGQFNAPSGIAFGPSGDLFVADRNNERVQRFAPDGTFLEQFRIPSGVKYKGSYTLDLDVDAQGRLYVLTTEFATEDEVNVFAPTGGVKVPKQKLGYRKGSKLKVKVACSGPASCKGRLSIATGKRGLTLAKGRYTVGARKTKAVAAKLTRKGKKALARGRKHKVKVTVASKTGAKVSRKLTLVVERRSR